MNIPVSCFLFPIFSFFGKKLRRRILFLKKCPPGSVHMEYVSEQCASRFRGWFPDPGSPRHFRIPICYHSHRISAHPHDYLYCTGGTAMLSEQQLQTLYNSLSLTEKVGQLLQVSGAEFTADGEVTGIGNSKYTPEELHAAGSVLGDLRRGAHTAASGGTHAPQPDTAPVHGRCDRRIRLGTADAAGAGVLASRRSWCGGSREAPLRPPLRRACTSHSPRWPMSHATPGGAAAPSPMARTFCSRAVWPPPR